jgi:uncharacterized protein (DUF4415 family)
MSTGKPRRLSIAEKRALAERRAPERQADTDPEPDYVEVEYYDADYEDITPQAQAADPTDWSDLVISEAVPKKPISLRLDPDVLAFFKAQGPGYQTRINAVLRTYMAARTKVRRP